MENPLEDEEEVKGMACSLFFLPLFYSNYSFEENHFGYKMHVFPGESVCLAACVPVFFLAATGNIATGTTASQQPLQRHKTRECKRIFVVVVA